MPKTLLDKIWENHVISQEPGCPAILYIDRHLFHEVTSPQAFDMLRTRKLKLRNPSKTLGIIDHSIPTTNRDQPSPDPIGQKQIATCEKNCQEFGLSLFHGTHPNQGIVHVSFPELGIVHPGMTLVCGDSHTATHGAFGALAFGIGTSEVGHVFATQCLLQFKPKAFEVYLKGELPPGVTAKDLILALINKIGIGGGTGCAFEFRGPAVKNISMEGRMTICNMAIEGGARSGLFAPDEITFEYLRDKPNAPKGAAWEENVTRWKKLKTDDGANFDQSITINLNEIEPMVTYGDNPAMSIGISAKIPDPKSFSDETSQTQVEGALEYLELKSGAEIKNTPIDYVFIGSCTNARIEDFRQAAEILKNKKIAEHVTALAVPGSYPIKEQAEKEGIADLFKAAGFEWREPGCSMCLGMNPDKVPAGKRCASTSNRNFRGRQGPGSKTHLMSPIMAAAAAVAGQIVDVREYFMKNNDQEGEEEKGNIFNAERDNKGQEIPIDSLISAL